MDLVSVIIPVYNGEETIAETLDSVLAQTYDNLEVLVMDDGSTDRTPRIVEAFEDPRVHFHRFANSGAPRNRNRGIRQSQGSFVSFLDADDLWSEDKVEKQLRALQAAPLAGVAYSFTSYISSDGRILHGGYQEPLSGNVLPELFVRFFLQSGSNALVRREVFETIGWFDETLDVCDDYDFYLRVAERFPFVLVPEHQIYYRLSTSSLSSDAWKMRDRGHRVIRDAVSRSPEVLEPLYRQAVAVVDGYIFGKILDQPKTWRSVVLCAKCLFSQIPAGRARWRYFFQRRKDYSKHLSKLVRWLLPAPVRKLLRWCFGWIRGSDAPPDPDPLRRSR